VIYEGQSLEGALVKLTRLENDAVQLETHMTDRWGAATFSCDRGGWLLNVIWTKPLPRSSETDFETIFSSLSFGFPASHRLGVDTRWYCIGTIELPGRLRGIAMSDALDGVRDHYHSADLTRKRLKTALVTLGRSWTPSSTDCGCVTFTLRPELYWSAVFSRSSGPPSDSGLAAITRIAHCNLLQP